MDAPTVSTAAEPVAPAASRAVRKKQETRERLYEAAVSLFVEKGYEATTVDDIAARADTARGTAFNHFPSKSHFTFEWTARRRRRAVGAMEKLVASQDSTADQLRAYFRELAAENAGQYELTRQMVTGWVRAGGPIEDDPWLAEELVSCLEAGRTRGEVGASCSPYACACLLRDAYLGLIYRWIREPGDPPFSCTVALERTIETVLAGIIARPAPELRP